MNVKVIGKTINMKAKEHLFGKMEIDMKVNLKMTMKKEKEFITI